jgi:hypothetical protein
MSDQQDVIDQTLNPADQTVPGAGAGAGAGSGSGSGRGAGNGGSTDPAARNTIPPAGGSTDPLGSITNPIIPPGSSTNPVIPPAGGSTTLPPPPPPPGWPAGFPWPWPNTQQPIIIMQAPNQAPTPLKMIRTLCLNVSSLMCTNCPLLVLTLIFPIGG